MKWVIAVLTAVALSPAVQQPPSSGGVGPGSVPGAASVVLVSSPMIDSPIEGDIVDYYPPRNSNGWIAPWMQGTSFNQHLPAIVLRAYPQNEVDLAVFCTDHYGDPTKDLVSVHGVPHGSNGNGVGWWTDLDGQ
jgi:hypothetical protein